MEVKGMDLLLRAADIAFDQRKILAAVAGMVAIAIVVGLPMLLVTRTDSAVLGVCLTIPALIAGWVLTWLTIGTVARLSYEDLSGTPQSSVQEALSIAGRRLPSLLFSPLLLVLGAVGLIVVELLIFLVGRIPYAGELWAACWFLPVVIVNLAILVVFMLGFWIMPFIIVGEETGVVETLPRTVRTVLRAPGQIFSYLILTWVVLALIGMLLFTLLYGAIGITAGVAGIGLGAQKLSQFLGPVGLAPGLMPGMGLRGFGGGGPFTIRLAQIILGIAVLILVAVIYSVFLVLPLSLGCAVYLSVREGAAVGVGQAEPTTRACSNCGAPLGPDDRFCLQCGAEQ
ncbi:MAG: zinc ribbon domain-containing protein [Anaerolineae bacterium]|jgi:hypothetical protein